MPFSADISIEAAIRALFCCEICGVDLYDPDPDAVAKYVIHSGTSLHLIGGPERYFVTNAPTGFKRLENTWIRGKLFSKLLKGRKDDAFCLCPTCHRNLTVIALRETKIAIQEDTGEIYTGRTSIPYQLLEITMHMIEIGRSSI